MAVTYRTLGPWGAGKGANLQPSEVDANFYELAQAIVDIQNNPEQPNGIETISVSGTQMTITLTDGTVMGPFTLPVLTFRWRGEFEPGVPYAVLDVFTFSSGNTHLAPGAEARYGIFMVQIAGMWGGFNPDLLVDGLPVYLQLFGSVDTLLSTLGDVDITGLAQDDVLIWNAGTEKWTNATLGDLAFQEQDNVYITGGQIHGMATPVAPGDVATKAYVDALPLGMSIPTATIMSNMVGGSGPALPNTLSDILDYSLVTTVRGTLLFRGGAGWTALAPGANGLFLQTHAAGADPTWAVGGSGVTSLTAGSGIDTTPDTITATGTIALAAVADNSLLANASGASAAPTATTLSAFLDHAVSNARGTILTRTVGGWVALAPGLVGQYLKSLGSGADLAWDSPAGAGTVTSVGSGTGLTGGPITGSGTLALAAIANNSVLANISGGSAAPGAATPSLLFDSVFGTTQGAVLYRSATAWVMLTPGTSGQVLTTGGSAANPSWANAPAGSPVANQQIVSNISGSTAAPVGNTLTNLLDSILGSSRGLVIYRGASGWAALSPGTSGQVLTTGGATGDPHWAAGGTGGASISVGDTPPASPSPGDAWWDGVSGQLYIRVDDGTSVQWVPASNQPGPAGPASAITSITATAPLTGGGSSGAVTIGIPSPLPLANGGTNATSAAAARTSLGAVNIGGDNITGNLNVAGNVGIGTTAPGSKLDVVGGIAAVSETIGPSFGGHTAKLSVHQTTNGTDAIVALRATNSGPTGNFVRFLNNDASANLFVVDILGALTATQGYKPGGGVWADTSDVRTKEGIADYTKGLAEVTALRPVSYTYNGELGTVADGKTYIGLIADEVRPVMPEMVGTTEYKPDFETPPVEVLTLDTTALLFALINCVKELSARLAAVEMPND